MFQRIFKALPTLALTLVSCASLFAQDQGLKDRPSKSETTKADWESLFSSANESAVVDHKGRATFLKLPVRGQGVKSFSLTHAEDGKSFVLTDERGIRLEVVLGKDQRIQSIMMPDGRKLDIEWRKSATGDWLPQGMQCENIMIEEGGNACRDALYATGIALAVCATAGPLSIPCLAATANAAYHVARCYEETQTHLSFTKRNRLNKDLAFNRRFRQRSSFGHFETNAVF